MPQQAFGHRGAGRVVGTDEENLLFAHPESRKSVTMARALSGQAETNSMEPRTGSGTAARSTGPNPKRGKKLSAISVRR